MLRFFSLFVTLVGLGCLLLPSPSLAATVDLAITASSLSFSDDTLIEGQPVRIYATIRNYGDTDATGYVVFYLGSEVVGKSQVVSILADGAKDDVFVDFTPPAGSFNIRAEVKGASPEETNFSNNEALTPRYSAAADTDGDGVIDDEDNCPERDNLEQNNLDGDGKGDICDTDIDGDGVVNINDDFPEDASRSEKTVAPAPVVVAPEPQPTPEPAPVQVEQEVAPPAAPEPEAEPALEPQVEGVQDEQSEPTEVALDLSGLGYGGPVSSPAARFTYEQKTWRTYEFTAVPPLGGGEYTFAWDFGDGATSAQASLTHTFPASGVYTVTLATVAADGTVTSDSEQLAVSFFHLSNPLLLVTLAALILIIGGLLVLIFRLRRGEEL